jgi:hypothetical protein
MYTIRFHENDGEIVVVLNDEEWKSLPSILLVDKDKIQLGELYSLPHSKLPLILRNDFPFAAGVKIMQIYDDANIDRKKVRVTDEYAQHIMLFTSLCSLSFRGCHGLQGAFLLKASMLINLDSLYIHNCHRMHQFLVFSNTFMNLKNLSLSCMGITYRTLQQISTFTNLESLDCVGCSLLEIGKLDFLSLLTNLTMLDLGNCSKEQDGADISYLSYLTALLQLCISTGNDVDISAVSRLSKLTSLSFLTSNISDDDLAYLGILPMLEELNLRGCDKITADSLQLLLNLTALKKLDFGAFRGLTSDKVLITVGDRKHLDELRIDGGMGGRDMLKAILDYNGLLSKPNDLGVDYKNHGVKYI